MRVLEDERELAFPATRASPNTVPLAKVNRFELIRVLRRLFPESSEGTDISEDFTVPDLGGSREVALPVFEASRHTVWVAICVKRAMFWGLEVPLSKPAQLSKNPSDCTSLDLAGVREAPLPTAGASRHRIWLAKRTASVGFCAPHWPPPGIAILLEKEGIWISPEPATRRELAYPALVLPLDVRPPRAPAVTRVF